MVSKRREVRIKVMQVLYASEISQEPLEKVKKDHLSEITDEDSINFSNNLIERVTQNTEMLDEFIVKKVENWEFERIAIVDKIIIRMGIAELLYFPDIPPKVSINETSQKISVLRTAANSSMVCWMQCLMNLRKITSWINRAGDCWT